MQDAMHEFQDWVLEEAKKELLKGGNSLSRAFILAPMMKVPERIRRCCEPRSEGPNEAGAHFRDNVMLMVPISYNNERLLYSYIRHLGQEDREAGLDALVASGTSLEAIISACKRAHNATEKDICAAFLHKFCHDVHAVAICKLDEVRMKASPPNSGSESLDADPDAFEAIMSVLETKDGYRVSSMPVVRSQRDTGVVQDFGKLVTVLYSKGDPRNGLSGRFAGLLPVGAQS